MDSGGPLVLGRFSGRGGFIERAENNCVGKASDEHRDRYEIENQRRDTSGKERPLSVQGMTDSKFYLSTTHT